MWVLGKMVEKTEVRGEKLRAQIAKETEAKEKLDHDVAMADAKAQKLDKLRNLRVPKFKPRV